LKVEDTVPTTAQVARVPGPETRLAELGLELPDAPAPLGDYPPVQVVGDLMYTTAVLPMWNGELRHAGALGSHVGLPTGVAAARLCGLNLLALIRAHAGSLDNVRQVVQVIGLVNSAPGFAQQTKVLNGLSELIVAVFGEGAGRHSRTALGTTELPMDATVQATAVVRIDPAALAMPEGNGVMSVAGVPVEGKVSGVREDVEMPVGGPPLGDVVREDAGMSAGRAPAGRAAPEDPGMPVAGAAVSRSDRGPRARRGERASRA
jgi:enamine deaminase RidA (YjgF/YER057c/UK114 family)